MDIVFSGFIIKKWSVVLKRKGKKSKYILFGGINILLELLLLFVFIVFFGVGVGVWLEDDVLNINDCK